MSEGGPFVAIIAAGACSPVLIDEVLWGLEEEGVPACLLPSRNGSVQELARMAAMASPLDLGIALGSAGECAISHAAVHGRCVLESVGPLTRAQARCAGGLAARLAKRVTLPLDAGAWRTI